MNQVVITAVSWVLRIIEYTILARIIISWLPIPKDNQLISLLYQVTEPILAPIRGIIERSSMGKNMILDFSPLIAFLLIEVIRNILVGLL